MSNGVDGKKFVKKKKIKTKEKLATKKEPRIETKFGIEDLKKLE